METTITILETVHSLTRMSMIKDVDEILAAAFDHDSIL